MDCEILVEQWTKAVDLSLNLTVTPEGVAVRRETLPKNDPLYRKVNPHTFWIWVV